MEFKQDTVSDIIDSEHQMVMKAEERFGKYYIHAMDAYTLVSDFVASVDADRHLFALFLSQIRKHLILAILSTVRLHKIQAMMDMRQVLEAGSCAAYAIANPEISGFADIGDDGLVDPSQDLTKKRYGWLEQNFSEGSKAIKGMKKCINASTAHSNVVYAMQNFSVNLPYDKFDTPFFDKEDDYHIKADLWMIGNVAYGLMDLFFGVNVGKGVVKFKPDFPERLKRLREKNDELKAAMMSTDRYSATAKKFGFADQS
jgi:hypothetical protein